MLKIKSGLKVQREKAKIVIKWQLHHDFDIIFCTQTSLRVYNVKETTFFNISLKSVENVGFYFYFF